MSMAESLSSSMPFPTLALPLLSCFLTKAAYASTFFCTVAEEKLILNQPRDLLPVLVLPSA